MKKTKFGFYFLIFTFVLFFVFVNIFCFVFYKNKETLFEPNQYKKKKDFNTNKDIDEKKGINSYKKENINLFDIKTINKEGNYKIKQCLFWILSSSFYFLNRKEIFPSKKQKTNSKENIETTKKEFLFDLQKKISNLTELEIKKIHKNSLEKIVPFYFQFFKETQMEYFTDDQVSVFLEKQLFFLEKICLKKILSRNCFTFQQLLFIKKFSWIKQEASLLDFLNQNFLSSMSNDFSCKRFFEIDDSIIKSFPSKMFNKFSTETFKELFGNFISSFTKEQITMLDEEHLNCLTEDQIFDIRDDILHTIEKETLEKFHISTIKRIIEMKGYKLNTSVLIFFGSAEGIKKYPGFFDIIKYECFIERNIGRNYRKIYSILEYIN